MTNVLICGILGRMGKQLVESAAGTDVRVSSWSKNIFRQTVIRMI